MAVHILCDSSADLTIEEIREMGLLYVPIPVIFGNKSYAEGINITKDEFYEKLAHQLIYPTTSQPSPAEFLKFFQQAKAAGDEIIAILIPEALSGTYQNAALAKDMADYEHIHLIDSNSIAAASRILLEEAVRLRDSGAGCQEIISGIEEIKGKTYVFAALDTLENLYRGGRLTKAQTGIGEFAGIKPVVSLSEDGSVTLAHKSLGRSKACAKIIKELASIPMNTNYPLYFIYSNDDSNLNQMRSKLDKAGFDYGDIKAFNIGPTIGTHIGAGAFGFCCVLQ